MAANDRDFTLIGKFDDQITKKLKALTEELNKFVKPLAKDNVTKSLSDGFDSANKSLKELQKSFDNVMKSSSEGVSGVSKGITGMTGSLDDAARSAGKVRDTVSQIGEGVKGLDGIGESLEAASRAAARVQSEVEGIGESAGKATGRAEDLMQTLLKADALSKIGDGIAQGFEQGFSKITGLASKGAGLVGKLFRESMEDELADVKAASGIQGSFGLAGYKGDFKDAQRVYKAYDREVSEMIKTSSAPTAKVIELQRYTLDTIGPLLLAAEGVKKGTDINKIDPKAIESSAKTYGKLLEKVAILGQGTGSAGFRVASGIEQLVTRGKIDTQLDFFTDNILLMQNLQAAGFTGRGGKTGSMEGKTDAERLRKMIEAFDKSMSGEATAAMATSLTGSLQALSDTITNPSAGILGMSVTFGKDTQKKVNATVREIYNERIKDYQNELKNSKTLTEERKKQLEVSIKQATKTRDQLSKEGEERITTPFQAFSFAFSRLVQSLTNAMSSIGPVWENFAAVAIRFTEEALGPLAENLNAIASEMRAKKLGPVEGFGRIVGEIYKKVGELMSGMADMLTSPTGAGAKAQSEFSKGFMSAFQSDPAQLAKAREGISRGISALIGKLLEVLGAIAFSEALRPFVTIFIAAMFGPPVISAVVSAVIPLMITGFTSLTGAFFATAMGTLTGTTAATTVAATAAKTSMTQAYLGGTLARHVVPGTAGAAALKAPAAGGLLSSGSLAAFLTNPVTIAAAVVASLAVIAKITEPVVKAVSPVLQNKAAALSARGQQLLSTANDPSLKAKKSDFGYDLAASVGFSGAQLNQVNAGFWTLFQGQVMDAVNDFMLGFNQLFAGLADMVVGMFSDPKKVKEGVNKIFIGIGRLITFIGHAFGSLVLMIPGLVTGVASAIANLFSGIGMAIQEAWNNRPKWMGGSGGGGARPPGTSSAPDGQRATLGGRPVIMRNGKWVAAAFGSANPFMGTLGEAINFEMANKPAGSHLVIANSSETIIPAAGGFGDGLQGLISAIWGAAQMTTGNITKSVERGAMVTSSYLSRGFSNTQNVLGQGFSNTQQMTARSMEVSSRENTQILQAIRAAAAAGGFGAGAGGLGNVPGGLSSAAALAQSFGLSLTSYKRSGPASASYHNVGRAMDFSNGSGPTPQMMAFAQQMVRRHGSQLTELFYTPLGFSIKHGQRVAPIAAGTHYNHVHVAYALGSNKPAFFKSATAADAWEASMAPNEPIISSVRATASEVGRGSVTIHAPITIYQQPGQDAEQVAKLAAIKIAMAVNEARNHM